MKKLKAMGISKSVGSMTKLYALKFLGDDEDYYLLSNDRGFLEECMLDLVEEFAYIDWAYDMFGSSIKTHHEFSHKDCHRYWEYACADFKSGVVIVELPSYVYVPEVTKVETNLFDKSTTYTNCTVEVWENSVTGESSVGWYRTEDTEEICTS